MIHRQYNSTSERNFFDIEIQITPTSINNNIVHKKKKHYEFGATAEAAAHSFQIQSS